MICRNLDRKRRKKWQVVWHSGRGGKDLDLIHRLFSACVFVYFALVLDFRDKAHGDDLSLLAGNLLIWYWVLRKQAGSPNAVLFPHGLFTYFFSSEKHESSLPQGD